MRDIWYADKRDLVKWAVLFRLADKFRAKRILQIAYYRPSNFEKIKIDSQKSDIPPKIKTHFRNIRNTQSINSKVKVLVFDKIFQDRNVYLKAIITLLPKYRKQRCVVFLDPDTGLEPLVGNPSLEHVRESEAKIIWKEIKPSDVFVFYQHRIRDKNWVNVKKQQLEKVIGRSVKVAHGLKIANDVVFFYTQKPL